MILIKYLLLAIAWVIHRLPYVVHQMMAWAVAVLWFDILRIRRRDAIQNVLRVFPNKSKSEATKMARISLYHMGLTLVEFFSLPFLDGHDFRQMYEVQGEEYLREALKLGRGVFALSVHTGNGDMGSAALASWGYPIHIISKIFKNPWLNKLWFSSREAKGVRFIPPRKSSYDVLKALKNNQVVVFVLDQYTGPPNGILTRFFGIQTGTAAGLALFALRSEAPVLPVYAQRLGRRRHRIVIKPAIPLQEQADKENTILQMTETYNRQVEAAILECPEQWMWVHRRWKMGFSEQEPIPFV